MSYLQKSKSPLTQHLNRLNESKNLTRFYMECNTELNTPILSFSVQQGLCLEALTCDNF